MNKLCALVASLLILAGAAFAQTHHATLSWTLSTGTGVVSQNVYRAPCTSAVSNNACTEGTFAVLQNVAATVTTFTDSTVTGGNSYSYFVTAVCPTTGACQGESVASNHYAVTDSGYASAPADRVDDHQRRPTELRQVYLRLGDLERHSPGPDFQVHRCLGKIAGIGNDHVAGWHRILDWPDAQAPDYRDGVRRQWMRV